MFSALRRGGKRLYELARQGVEVEREPREVTVHSIRLVSVSLPDFVIHVRCGKGTYVRTLAADLGAALGCGAALAGLVRTRVGPFALESARHVGRGAEARSGETRCGRGSCRPTPRSPRCPRCGWTPTGRAPSRTGRRWPRAAARSGWLRVYGPDDALLGVGQGLGDRVKPERLLHADPQGSPVLPA